ncbi:MAG TPA: glycoside hydrolase family 3 N-terminal domain-containing protein [Steroidobacteraceae bacterium]|jgi:beta-glucosidase|nr:glycoside hydrolase family 3 N-terminal domain-containing protein [Steroidobacteraceae bacterium]
MKHLALSGVLLFCALSVPSFAADKAPLYQDRNASVDQRVEDLLARMTLPEKIAQITAVWTQKPQIFDARGNVDPAKIAKVFPAGIGQFSRPNDLAGAGSPLPVPFRDERRTVELVNALQKHAMTETRLGIPVMFHEEAVHGYAARGATNFPIPIGLASTWDPQLITRVMTIAAREARARGALQVLAPVVDVARDPRWGRIEETYGEDPYLVGELGLAAVRGYQGDTLPLAPGKVFATLKHMTGHGQPESGTNVGPANISERILREVFFPPFIKAVKLGHAQAVMPSYNEIDGVPSHANRWLLGDILRGEMGFDGVVVSDYWGILDLARLHHVEPDGMSAGIRALQAGVDVDFPDGDSFDKLPAALAKGLVTQAQIDTAVRRVLRLKFLAGLFENPYADAAYAEKITDNAEARALAAEAARKVIVLLKNDGALPFRMDSLKTLAVIGPNAATPQIGGYSDVPTHVVTMLDGIRAKVGDKVKILTAEGVRITDAGDWWMDEVKLAKPEENRARIQEAVKVAKDADAIVLFVGGNAAVSREAWDAGHMGDSTSLDLVGEQNELARAMFALGKPVVVVLINGRPYSVNEIAARANALVEGWYLGQEGGTAMADVLFGDANPGGKLPVTIARSVGQLPMFYNQKPSAHRGYIFGSKEPLFPFGFGLSYTTFEIGAPQLSASKIGIDGSVKVSVEVRNTGKVAGDEVVQLYVRDEVSSVTRPVKELKGFKRLTLAPGASTRVEFTLDTDAFSLWDANMKRVVEPGEFTIFAGPNSVELKPAKLWVQPVN